MNTAMKEKEPEVNIDDQLDRIFGPDGTFNKVFNDQLTLIQETRAAIARGFCETHTKFKEDLWNDGTLTCEVCLEEAFHAGDEGLEDEVDNG